MRAGTYPAKCWIVKTVETNLALPVAVMRDCDGLHTSNLTTGNGDFTKMKATKTERKIINALNAIIHARNLYFDAPTEQNSSYRIRVVNCHFDGKVCVECLYSGKTVQVAGKSFSDGNGNHVSVSFTDGFVS